MVGGAPLLVGASEDLQGTTCGIDCGDQAGPETVFVFSDKAFGDDAEAVARVVVHELGHAWGLEHVAAADNLMRQAPATTTQGWGDGCIALLDTQSTCHKSHERFCPPGHQDARAEIAARFGDGAPDTRPPSVEFTLPAGTKFATGEPIPIQVRVNDDHEGFGWRLSIAQLGWSQTGTEHTLDLELALPLGEHRLVLEAMDHANHHSEDAALINVRGDPAAYRSCNVAMTGSERFTGLLAFIFLVNYVRRPALLDIDSPQAPAE